MGQAHERLGAHPLGRDRPFLVQLAGERVDGALADVDRAAGAQRPAARPRRQPRRAPTGQPAAAVVAGDAQGGDAVARVAVDEPQRPARRLHLDDEPVGGLAIARQASRDAVVAGRAALAQRPDGVVGGAHLLGVGLELVVAPMCLDVVDRPRPASQDAGRRLHACELRVRQMSRKHWGWGAAEEQPSRAELEAAAAGMAEHLGFGATDVEEPVALEDIRLPAPRVAPPDTCPAETDAFHRVRFGLGCSYADVVRGMRGQIAHPPDAVLFPRDERELAAALGWAADVNVAVIPVGGGTSVVGGIEPRVPDRFDGVVSLSLAAFDRVHEIDHVSRSARVGAGLTGPALEEQLGADGMTMRFYPQSFQHSTVGGWIATRAGGHFATGPTHVDDVVESVRAITPAGTWESRRLPGSGAGPSPDRLLLGSEGTLGVITEAWVRVQPRPEHRAGRTVRFKSFENGAEAVRAIVQSGLQPANCRLIEAGEARFTMAGDGSAHLLVLGFESTAYDVERELGVALGICTASGGEPEPPKAASSGAWRTAFLRAPYVRDTFAAMGVLSDTFETAITWERFDALREAAVTAVRGVLDDERATVTCRFTHAYPDGPAPYFTVLAPARRGEEADQWWAVKRAASDAVIEAGGTITHHHAVGRDHRPWYDRQRPEPFAQALRGAKGAVDPAGVLNPGVLI